MARYLGVSAGKWKYWEIHVEGGVVTLDEGALGTLGKRTVHTFPDEAAARKDAAAREKKVLAKGYTLQPEPTNLAADLFAAFAPCFVEAQRGDPARAATKALAALQARDLAEPKELGMCPVLLARRGHADVAQQVIDAFDAQRDELHAKRAGQGTAPWPQRRRSCWGACESLRRAGRRGPRDHADVGRRRGPGPHTYQREGVALAAALLDHGRREDARALFGALGHFGLDALLARGALEWSDAIAPGALTDPWTRDHYRLARATVVGNEAFAQTFAAMVDEDLGAMSTRRSPMSTAPARPRAAERAGPEPRRGAGQGCCDGRSISSTGAHPRSERVSRRSGSPWHSSRAWAMTSAPSSCGRRHRSALVRAATALQQQAPGAAVMTSGGRDAARAADRERAAAMWAGRLRRCWCARGSGRSSRRPQLRDLAASRRA
jgi:predicted DNA-binding WGR domain protein